MKFGLMFFASSEDALARDKYRLVLESAKFADRHGFSTVWVPERHFTRFGCLYPNPAVLHAAVAMATERIRLHAGSVVAPLHNPIRIAEEWAMVDNLSHGRVGISFASGWNPDDFAFFPDRYHNRHAEMYAGIRQVQQLWRGGLLDVASGSGKQIQVKLYPTPLQRELPTWITAAGNPESFVRAGEFGANLLTHLLDQDEEQLAHKIALYRRARADHGWDPAGGAVTVMLHTLVGEDAGVVREQARRPFCQYIKSNIGLLDGLAHSRGQNVDIAALSASDLDEFVEFLYERFAATRGLIGTPESCRSLVQSLERMGVDEIACLLDFGPDADLILQNLPHLARLQDLCGAPLENARVSAKVEAAPFSPDIVKARLTEELPGGSDASIERIWRRDGEALGLIRLPPELASAGTYGVHPAFLDACSRVLTAALPGHQADFYIPSRVNSIEVHAPVPASAWSLARVKPGDADAIEGDIAIYDSDGRLVIDIEGLRLQKVGEGRRTFADLLYRRIWKPSTREVASQGRNERWLILADRSGTGRKLAGLLEKGGASCDMAFAGEVRYDGIVYLCGLDATPAGSLTVDALTHDQERIAGGVLQLLRALSAQPTGAGPRVWFATRGAMAVLDGESPEVSQSPLWGLARTVSVEYPALWGGLVDLDPGAAEDSAALDLYAFLCSRKTEDEDMVAFRNGRRYAARLVRDDRPSDSRSSVRFSADATYLITGGSGIALELSVWMAQRGARNLALWARRAPAEAAQETLRHLEGMGVRARFFHADVARQEEVAAALAEMGHTMPALKGVFHLAGSLDDALLAGQEIKGFRAAGLAKVEGAWNLHHLTQSAALDHFVLFSSVASLATLPGQGNYAAANSFLDALAGYRRSRGLPALSVNWGPWSHVGHAATEYGRRAHKRLAQLGIAAIEPELGLEVLGFLMEQDRSHTGVMRSDWATFFRADPAASLSPLFSDIVTVNSGNLRQPAEPSEIMSKLRALPAGDREQYLASFLSELIGGVLKVRGAKTIGPRQGLFELGLDSLMALELKGRLEISLGRSFRPTLIFTSPTIEALVDHLMGDLFGGIPESLSEETLADMLAREIERAV